MFKKHVISALVLGFLTGGANAASLIPPGANPGGQSASISVMQWMEWTFAFDNAVDGGNPISDGTGAFQNLKQTYPVFMMGGATETGVMRSFSMAAGKPLAIPLFTVSCVSSDGFDCSDSSVTDFVDDWLDSADQLHLEIDGTVLVDANTAGEVDAIEDQLRVASDFFHIDVAANNWAGEPKGTWPNSYTDGYFAFVEGLPIGEHNLSFGGGAPGDPEGFYVGVEANVVVTPVPTALPLLLGGLAALGLVARSRRRTRI